MTDDTTDGTSLDRRSLLKTAGIGLATTLSGCSENLDICSGGEGLACDGTPYQHGGPGAPTETETPETKYAFEIKYGTNSEAAPKFDYYTNVGWEYPTPNNEKDLNFDILRTIPVDISRIQSTLTLLKTRIPEPIEFTLHLPTDTSTPAPTPSEQTYETYTTTYTPETDRLANHEITFSHDPINLPSNISYQAYISFNDPTTEENEDKFLTYQPFIQQEFTTPDGIPVTNYYTHKSLVWREPNPNPRIWTQEYDSGQVVFFQLPSYARPRHKIVYSTISDNEVEHITQKMEDLNDGAVPEDIPIHHYERKNVDNLTYLSTIADSLSSGLNKLGVTNKTDEIRQAALIAQIMEYTSDDRYRAKTDAQSQDHVPSIFHIKGTTGDCSDKSYLTLKLLWSKHFEVKATAISCRYAGVNHALVGVPEDEIEAGINHGYWGRTSTFDFKMRKQKAENEKTYTLIDATEIQPLGLAPRDSYSRINEEFTMSPPSYHEKHDR